MSLTTDPNDPKLKEGQKNETGQHTVYLVLSEEERAKGFVRPYRDSYVHKGRFYKFWRDTEMLDKVSVHDGTTYVAKVPVLADENGKYHGWSHLTNEELASLNNTQGYVGGCGSSTKMARPIAETYSRNPHYYGATFCCSCNRHLPVGEFVWDGTDERVGS